MQKILLAPIFQKMTRNAQVLHGLLDYKHDEFTTKNFFTLSTQEIQANTVTDSIMLFFQIAQNYLLNPKKCLHEAILSETFSLILINLKNLTNLSYAYIFSIFLKKCPLFLLKPLMDIHILRQQPQYRTLYYKIRYPKAL